MEFTIETVALNYPIVVQLGIRTLDVASKAIFEMYAQNVCQQLEWNNGSTATNFAKDGATKLIRERSRTGVVGAAILFGICIRQQLDWGNGGYATEVAEMAARVILPSAGGEGIQQCQRLFQMCIDQQLEWGEWWLC